MIKRWQNSTSTVKTKLRHAKNWTHGLSAKKKQYLLKLHEDDTQFGKISAIHDCVSDLCMIQHMFYVEKLLNFYKHHQ